VRPGIFIGLDDDPFGTTSSLYPVMAEAGRRKEASCVGEVFGAVELNDSGEVKLKSKNLGVRDVPRNVKLRFFTKRRTVPSMGKGGREAH
jgi:hypothetical protein